MPDPSVGQSGGSRMEAIRTVLAQYRSTDGRITGEQITAAWDELASATALLDAAMILRAGQAENGHLGGTADVWLNRLALGLAALGEALEAFDA